jgi:hypothetical protein
MRREDGGWTGWSHVFPSCSERKIPNEACVRTDEAGDIRQVKRFSQRPYAYSVSQDVVKQMQMLCHNVWIELPFWDASWLKVDISNWNDRATPHSELEHEATDKTTDQVDTSDREEQHVNRSICIRHSITLSTGVPGKL